MLVSDEYPRIRSLRKHDEFKEMFEFFGQIAKKIEKAEHKKSYKKDDIN